jgi:DNA-binding GntR family transcriptional regulator
VTARLSPPRYALIAQSLRERVEAGEFGDELPSIDKLGTEYGVGRATVAKAIGVLVYRDKLIEHRNGYMYAVIKRE